MQRMDGNRRTAPRTVASPRRRRLGLGLGLAGVLLGAGWPFDAADAAHVVRPWPTGRPAPPLDLVDLDGRRWRLDALAGQVVVLNFWATWCEPCRREMPSLEALAARRRAEGVVVFAVNYLETPEKIRRFLERAPFRPPILLDSEGDATVAWTPRVFPSTVIVGRDGRPAATVVGELDWGASEADALLDPLTALAGPR
jgi:thiol-disulfide isomerase/thioredoxin